MKHLLTAAELAAFLGISASGVRQIVRRHQVTPRAREGRAHLYDPDDVLRHAGTFDRRGGRNMPSHMSQ